MRLSWIIASCLVALPVGEGSSEAAPKPGAAVPVLDLRVGLAQNVIEPGRSLWFGTGQAGVSSAPSGPERAVGLTAAGRTLVQAIYASGGLIDVSYLLAVRGTL